GRPSPDVAPVSVAPPGNITGAVAKPPGLPRLRLIRAPLSRCNPGKRSATGEYLRAATGEQQKTKRAAKQNLAALLTLAIRQS
ncbi:hypothetical protein CAC00_30410, partial [Raoultella ornithinolytica]